MHAYAHPKVVSEREKNELDTQKKRVPRTGSAQPQCLVTAKCVRAPLGRNQKNVMKLLTDCIHHCLLNVSPFPSASSRALYEGTKNKEFRDTKPNLFSSLLERVGSVILVQHGSPSRAFPPPARATVKSASQIEAILTYIIAFKRARAKRAKCV